MASEREKMLAGALYDPLDAELAADRRRAREILQALNASGPGEEARRSALLAQLFGAAGDGLCIEPPFFCDYGRHIEAGRRVYFNFNCVVLDPAPVRIGDNVLFGPAVQVYTATHPLDAAERRSGRERALPVAIGSDVWIGGGAILLPGVTIGPGSVIGAGSVVTADVPAGVVAAGNPCRVRRRIDG